MIPRFLIDPVILMVPDESEPESIFENWVNALIRWTDEIQQCPYDWRHILSCTATLNSIGRFPDFMTLRRRCIKQGLDVDIATIARRITSFFQDESKDILLGSFTKCVVISKPSTQNRAITPNELVDRNHPTVQDDFANSLLCIAVDMSGAMPKSGNWHVLTKELSQFTRLAIASCEVAITDPAQSMSHLSTTQFELHQSIPLLFCPTDLNQYSPPVSILAAGQGAFIALIRRLATEQAAQSNMAIEPFALHSAFWNSLDSSNISRDVIAFQKLIRVCVVVILKQARELSSLKLRDIRISQAANSPPRKRASDNAGAWRLTISGHGAGWRLHYWDVPGSSEHGTSIQFVQVCVKSDPVMILD